MEFKFIEVVSAFIVLFAVIDVLGSMPLIINMKNKGMQINPIKTALVSFIMMVAFLFIGEGLLKLFAVDISSFAIAGSFVLLIMSMEMILGVEIFKHDSPESASIVPLAFPLIAGAGSFTTLLSLRSEYHSINIIIALTLNIVFVYIVLRLTHVIERIIGVSGVYVLKKFFGIILLAMAVKLFINNAGPLVAGVLKAH